MEKTTKKEEIKLTAKELTIGFFTKFGKKIKNQIYHHLSNHLKNKSTKKL
jgi:hypothetical protein